MGRDTFSRSVYSLSAKKFAPEEGPVTSGAERQSRATGKLNPLVDPQGFGVIRRSLPRLEKRKDKLWELLVGIPMPIETRLDTTGSMGGNVDTAFEVLPNMYEYCASVLPGYDLQIATGIFGDVQDMFPLCRPQFEMVAEKIVEQLTLMVPERQGGDTAEDPHYGLFGAAYLTAAHINCLDLKSYDFTVSDAPAHEKFDVRQLQRIFGGEVFEKVAENGHQINSRDLPTPKEVVHDLLGRAHAFFLQVGHNLSTTKFWEGLFGSDRVVILPSTELLPQVQATVIGLTEGTLDLREAKAFLMASNVSKVDAEQIVRSVANIPLGAQAALPNFARRPQKGDLFQKKTDRWPTDSEKAGAKRPEDSSSEEKDGSISWL